MRNLQSTSPIPHLYISLNPHLYIGPTSRRYHPLYFWISIYVLHNISLSPFQKHRSYQYIILMVLQSVAAKARSLRNVSPHPVKPALRNIASFIFLYQLCLKPQSLTESIFSWSVCCFQWKPLLMVLTPYLQHRQKSIPIVICSTIFSPV